MGNSRNTAEEIIANLDKYFDNYTDQSPFVELDFICIVGDLFDKEISFGSSAVTASLLWVSRLAHFCARHKIVLRLLRGTYSHDKDQCRQIEALIKSLTHLSDSLDFRYFETLDIEIHERLGISMLFIPDNHAPTTEITLAAVKSKMSQLGLEQVDFTFMHGTFRYQLKYGKDEHKHIESEYLALTKHYVFVGHIHNHSFYERIISHGSFDRLSHGEEEAKGGIVWKVDSNHERQFQFWPNTSAKIFKTVVLSYDDLDNSLKQISKEIKDLPEGSYVRIAATKNHPAILGLVEIQNRWPDLVFTKEGLDGLENEANSLQLIDAVRDDGFVPVVIDETNVVDMVLFGVLEKNQLSAREQQRLKEILLKAKTLK